MEWVLRLVGTGVDGQPQSFDVMEISRPDGVFDIANLGLTLAEGKRLLASVQQGRRCRGTSRQPCDATTGLPVLGPEMPCQRLADASDCHAVRRGKGAASPVSVCWLRSY
jgi:hypothetical protein